MVGIRRETEFDERVLQGKTFRPRERIADDKIEIMALLKIGEHLVPVRREKHAPNFGRVASAREIFSA